MKKFTLIFTLLMFKTSFALPPVKITEERGYLGTYAEAWRKNGETYQETHPNKDEDYNPVLNAPPLQLGSLGEAQITSWKQSGNNQTWTSSAESLLKGSWSHLLGNPNQVSNPLLKLQYVHFVEGRIPGNPGLSSGAVAASDGTLRRHFKSFHPVNVDVFCPMTFSASTIDLNNRYGYHILWMRAQFGDNYMILSYDFAGDQWTVTKRMRLNNGNNPLPGETSTVVSNGSQLEEYSETCVVKMEPGMIIQSYVQVGVVEDPRVNNNNKWDENRLSNSIAPGGTGQLLNFLSYGDGEVSMQPAVTFIP